MLILVLRSDKPEAEIGLFDDERELSYKTWQAHRKLAETIHQENATNLQFIDKKLSDIDGIVVYKGPGSFTGLRIGISVANALAYGLNIPIVGSAGKNWLNKGLKQIINGENELFATAEYGEEALVTPAK